MRLYDKMLTQAPKEVRDNMRAMAPQTTVITADAIAAHYADSPVQDWDASQYPYARPPWKTFFIEWNVPRQIRLENEIKTLPPTQDGVFCIAAELTDETRQAKRQHLSATVPSPDDRDLLLSALDRAAVVVMARPATYSGGRLVVPDMFGYWFIREDGYVVQWFNEHEDPRLAMVHEYLDAQGTSFGAHWYHVAFLALTFANCKNVKLIDVTEDVQPVQKIRRRLKLPDVRRYTLEISGQCVRPRREFNQGEQGVMPFHLCRGHFATYTAERPLFGKHVGRFWHPPHTRGKKENGVVLKDYNVVPPPADAEAIAK